MASLQWEGHTRIPSSTVCASVIAWNGLDQILKGSFVARLVTLAQCGGHVVLIDVVDSEERAGYWDFRGLHRCSASAV